MSHFRNPDFKRLFTKSLTLSSSVGEAASLLRQKNTRNSATQIVSCHLDRHSRISSSNLGHYDRIKKTLLITIQ